MCINNRSSLLAPQPRQCLRPMLEFLLHDINTMLHSSAAPTTTIRPEVKAILYVLFTFFQNTRKRFFTGRVNKGKTYKQSRCKITDTRPSLQAPFTLICVCWKWRNFHVWHLNLWTRLESEHRQHGSSEKIWKFHSLNKTQSLGFSLGAEKLEKLSVASRFPHRDPFVYNKQLENV